MFSGRSLILIKTNNRKKNINRFFRNKIRIIFQWSVSLSSLHFLCFYQSRNVFVVLFSVQFGWCLLEKKRNLSTYVITPSTIVFYSSPHPHTKYNNVEWNDFGFFNGTRMSHLPFVVRMESRNRKKRNDNLRTGNCRYLLDYLYSQSYSPTL